MTCITVRHQAEPTADGNVAVRRSSVLESEGSTTASEFSITLTPAEAREMAEAMRKDHARFFKERDGQSVEVWCELYEGFEINYVCKDGARVCEGIYCVESRGDGWSWELAQALEDAASEAEASE